MTNKIHRKELIFNALEANWLF